MLDYILIVFIHWIADFLLQDVKWAEKKSEDSNALLKHVFVYSFTFYFFLILWTLDVMYSFISFVLIFITHFIIDFITSKIVKYKFHKEEYGTSIPNTGAFTIIGFDQFLHYLTLFIILL